MNSVDDEIQSVSVTEFKAKCTEKLRQVEESGVSLKITRHGRTVAVIHPSKPDSARCIGDLMGSTVGAVTFSNSVDPDAPAWSDDEWQMHLEGADE